MGDSIWFDILTSGVARKELAELRSDMCLISLRSTSAIRPCNYIAIRVHTPYLGPSLELLHGHIFRGPESPLIPNQPPSCILARQQDLSKLLKS